MLKGARAVTSVTFAIAIGILAVVVLLFLISPSLKVPFTAKIISLERSSFGAGEPIKGDFSIFLQQGELLPANSNITINIDGATKQLSLKDFISLSNLSINSASGNFYIKDKNSLGYGLGYGWPGVKSSYPNVKFRVKIEEANSSNALATGNSDDTYTQSSLSYSSNDSSISGFSILRFFKKLFGLAGFVVISQENNNQIIEATCNYNEPFIYGLGENETASIVAGSVTVNGQSMPDDTVMLNLEKKFLAVSTDYVLEEKGFGAEFLNNISNEIALDLEKLSISVAQPGDYVLAIILSYNGNEISRESVPLTITEKTLMPESLDTQTVLESVNGKKVEDDPNFETTVWSAERDNESGTFTLVFSHDSETVQPIWIEELEPIDYQLSETQSAANENVTLAVYFTERLPKFRLHIGDTSEIFEFGDPVIVEETINCTECETMEGPYINQDLLAAQGLVLSDTTIESNPKGIDWVPHFETVSKAPLGAAPLGALGLATYHYELCNVSDNGFPLFHDAENVRLIKDQGTCDSCSPDDLYPCISLLIAGGEFDGVRFLPEDIISAEPLIGRGFTADIELEYMSTSYQTGTYDQKWVSDPSFARIDNDEYILHLLRGSGNVITARMNILENNSADSPVIVGIGDGYVGVFSQTTTKDARFDSGELLNSLNTEIKGVGYLDLNIQYAPNADFGHAYIDSYVSAEHIQLTTEVNATARDYSANISEASINSQVIGLYTGMKPILYNNDESNEIGHLYDYEFINYTSELELDYMPVSYQTGTYDEKWSVEPRFEDGNQYIVHGSGNIITDRLELEAQNHDLKPLVGAGSGVGVFSIEVFIQSWTSPCINNSLPGCDTVIPFRYIKSSVKGVGYRNEFIQFAPNMTNSVAYTDVYNNAEHLQLTTEVKTRVWNDPVLGPNTSVLEQNWNSNVIGTWDGAAPIYTLTAPDINDSDKVAVTGSPPMSYFNFTQECEFEYMPVSYQTGTYDQKWSIQPSFDGEKLHLASGSGNVITNRVEFEAEDPNLHPLVGAGSTAGVFSIEVFLQSWTSDCIGYIGPVCNFTGPYRYAKSSIKGVGYLDYFWQFAPNMTNSVAYTDVYNHAEHLQLTTEMKTRAWDDAVLGASSVLEQNWNSNVIGTWDGAAPMYVLTQPGPGEPMVYFNFTHEGEYEYAPIPYQTGTYDQKWSIQPSFDGEKLHLLSGSGNVITNRIEFEAEDPNLNPIVGVGSTTGVFSIEVFLQSWTSPCIWGIGNGTCSASVQGPNVTIPYIQPYRYSKSSVKGVGHMDYFWQFAPNMINSVAYTDVYNNAEHLQLTTEMKTRVWNDPVFGPNTSVLEQNWNSNVIGTWGGAAPMYTLTAPDINDSYKISAVGSPPMSYFNFTHEGEYEYMPVSYQTGTYDQKWSIQPSFDGEKLHIVSGSGNVITNRVEFEAEDPNLHPLVGAGSGAGVFSIEVFLMSWTSDCIGYLGPVCNFTGPYRYAKSSIKGVGHLDYFWQFAPNMTNSVAYTDVYNHAEQLQLTTEVKTRAWDDDVLGASSVLEQNWNSNVIGTWDGAAPMYVLAAPETPGHMSYFNFTHEGEYEYMPVSYQTGTYDQKWSLQPSFDGEKLYLISGSGNVITNRIELEAASADNETPALPPVAGMGGLTCVFSIENFAQAADSESRFGCDPDPGCTSDCCVSTGPYNYVKSSIKGVGYANEFIQFTPDYGYNTSFIDSYDHCEHIQFNTEVDTTSEGIRWANYNSNVIGVYEGELPFANDVYFKHDVELEYMPVSGDSGSYDFKWSIEPNRIGDEYYFVTEGTGNVIIDNVTFLPKNPIPDNFSYMSGFVEGDYHETISSDYSSYLNTSGKGVAAINRQRIIYGVSTYGV